MPMPSATVLSFGCTHILQVFTGLHTLPHKKRTHVIPITTSQAPTTAKLEHLEYLCHVTVRFCSISTLFMYCELSLLNPNLRDYPLVFVKLGRHYFIPRWHALPKQCSKNHVEGKVGWQGGHHRPCCSIV